MTVVTEEYQILNSLCLGEKTGHPHSIKEIPQLSYHFLQLMHRPTVIAIYIL